MSDDEFLAAFEECTLRRSQWTHEAHVRMAWLYLTQYPLAESIERARQGIRQLNATFSLFACGSGRNTDGYHDTITVAFIRLIAARHENDESFPSFCERNPDLFDRKLTALLRFYSKELLNSGAAKQCFIEPDLL